MTMINERIACPEISKGFIERTLHVQSMRESFNPPNLALAQTRLVVGSRMLYVNPWDMLLLTFL